MLGRALLVGLAAATYALLPRSAPHPRPSLRDSCPPDTSGRTIAASLTLGLAQMPFGTALEDERDHREVASAIRDYFEQPGALRLPLWARTINDHDTARLGPANPMPWHGLASAVTFRLKSDGRLADRKIFVSTASPDLDAAIVQAILHADSARAFPREDVPKRAHDGIIRLRTVAWDSSSAAAVPLLKLRIPVIVVDSPVRPLSFPAPRLPMIPAKAAKPGSVSLEYLVTAEGRVDPDRVVALQADNRQFLDAAVAAVKKATFVPARLRGCPMPILVHQRVSFTFGR